MRKKIMVAILAALILVPAGLVDSNPTTVYAAGGNNGNNDYEAGFELDPRPPNIEPAPRIDIKRKYYNNNRNDGIIMVDADVNKYDPTIKGDPWSFARNIASSKPSDHTGWSTEGNICERTLTHYDPIAPNGSVQHSPDVSYPKTSAKVSRWVARYQSKWHLGRDWGYPGVFQFNTFNQLDEGPLMQYTDQLDAKYSAEKRAAGITSWRGVRGKLQGVGYWNIRTSEWFQYPSRARNGSCETGDRWVYYTDNDIVMEGHIQVDRPDPSGSHQSSSTNDGDVAGQAYWELVRRNENANSGVDAFLDLTITGKHYAVRGFQQQLSLGGQTKTGKTPLKIEIPDGYTVKNHSINYSAAYEYTNHYKDIYRCSDSENGFCYEWTFVKREADWSKGKTFSFRGSSPVNHEMFEVKQESRLEGFTGKNYKVGNKETIQSKNNIQSTPYYETFSKGASNNRQSDISLKTQTGIPVTPGELSYSVSVPSGSQSNGGYKVLRREGTYGNLYPADVDTSLKSTYSNRSIIGGYQYAIPYQQSSYVDRGTSGGKRNLSWSYQSDLFLMGKHTGFQQGVNYAQDVRQNYLNSKSAPSESTARSRYAGTESALRSAYQSQTGQNLVDDMLPFDMEKAQRYMIPVEASSPLKPNVTHMNHRAIHNMGLNDMTFRYDQTFKFKRYLFGAIQDDAYIIEQTDPMVSLSDADQSKVKTIVISFDDAKRIAELNQTRTEKRVHEFRISDRNYIERIRQIVGEAQ